MQSAGTRLCTIIARDFVFRNRYLYLILCSGHFYALNGTLIMLPTAVIVHFPGNCDTITGCFFIWIFSARVERCGNKTKNCWNARNTRTSSCYFHRGCVESNLYLRNLVLLCPRTLSAISALSCPNNCYIRLSFFFVIMAHQSCDHFWGHSWKRSSFVRWTSRNNFSTCCLHFMNTELLFETSLSVNQLSVYGAATNWCCQFGSTEEEKGRASIPVDKKILTKLKPE